jgi:hypothetical protein
MELVSGPLSRDEYLHAVTQILDFLRKMGADQVFVTYGFGCECPAERMPERGLIPLERVLEFIHDSEAAGYYRLGKDNLHVAEESRRAEFLFCHESDIHLITEDERLFERMKAVWLANGYQGMHEGRGAGWVPIAPGARPSAL